MAAVAGGGSGTAHRAAAFAPINATLKLADGTPAGRLSISPRDERSVWVRVKAWNLAPGFHGFHLHGVGTCDPTTVDATGAPSPFLSAGGHVNPLGGVHGTGHGGDLPPLLVLADGTADARFAADGFTGASLMDADGSAVIVHLAPDNLAHIPARYHHADATGAEVPGPDASTLSTGDGGKRSVCGVLVPRKR